MSSVPDIQYDRRGNHLSFNLAAVIYIVSMVLMGSVQWYSTKSAIASGQNALAASVSQLQQHNREVLDPAAASEQTIAPLVTSLKDGVCLLVRDKGYTISACSAGGVSIGPTVSSQ